MGFYIKDGVLKNYEKDPELTEAVIPNDVTTIGYGAFDKCTSLTSITIPDSVTTIGEYAFYSCSSLTSITIPDSVTEIGDDAFEQCTSLTSIDVQLGNIIYLSIDGVLYNKTGSTLILCPQGKTSVTIPDSVTTIDKFAFSGCTSLERIIIPSSVTTIGAGAFGYCTSLSSITIPDSVTSIGQKAFGGCTSLTSITIPYGVTTIGESAFRNCTSLSSITIPDSVTSIGYWAFDKCTSLTSITIPDSVTSIGRYAFMNCTSLTSITIPHNVTSIDSSTFKGCTFLKKIDVKIGNRIYLSIDGVLYNKTGSTLFLCPQGKTSVTIPDSVTTIGYWAFGSCTSLTSIKIPDSVTTIYESAFESCTSLTSITIPDSVTTIEEYAFGKCAVLKKLKIFGYTLDSTQWNWEKVFPSDVKAMLDSKDYSIEMDSPTKYHIVTQVFLQDSQPEAETYIKKNKLKIIRHFIDIDDYDTVKSLLDSGKFVTKRNIGKLIEHAIEHTQQGGDMQIQILLTNYKYENFCI